MSLYRHGSKRALRTGWPTLDKHMTIREGELSVVTGIPNCGKSEFVDALVVGLAERFGWHPHRHETQDLRLKLTTYHWRDYLDVRTHVTLDATGERVPTKKGITVPVAKIRELRELIEKAEAEARAAGPLSNERRTA